MKPKKIDGVVFKHKMLPRGLKYLERGNVQYAKLVSDHIKEKHYAFKDFLVKTPYYVPYTISLLYKSHRIGECFKKQETIINNNFKCKIMNFEKDKASYISNLSSSGSFKGFKAFYSKIISKVK